MDLCTRLHSMGLAIVVPSSRRSSRFCLIVTHGSCPGQWFLCPWALGCSWTLLHDRRTQILDADCLLNMHWLSMACTVLFSRSARTHKRSATIPPPLVRVHNMCTVLFNKKTPGHRYTVLKSITRQVLQAACALTFLHGCGPQESLQSAAADEL